MGASLVIEALNRVLGHRRVDPDQLPIHTDQGSHYRYRTTDYRQLLESHKITYRISAKGCCWDNAVVESFFSTLRLELDLDDYHEVLISLQQLQRDLALWIEGYSNRARRHSTITYLSPIVDEQHFIAAHTVACVNP